MIQLVSEVIFMLVEELVGIDSCLECFEFCVVVVGFGYVLVFCGVVYKVWQVVLFFVCLFGDFDFELFGEVFGGGEEDFVICFGGLGVLDF